MATSFDTTLSTLGISSTASSMAANKATSNATMGQADFLKLMTAQMKYQDPFNPVDNTQMVAQMAQFSSLAGISEMSSTLAKISEKLGITGTGDAVSYIGRNVLTQGDTAYGRTTGGIAGAVELGADVSDVIVSISDANGTPLRTLSLGKQPAGTVTYDWDGKTDAGTEAGAGPFTVDVHAKNGSVPVAATGLVWAPVQSVSTTTGTAVLTLPGIGDVPAAAIRQIG